MTLGTTLKGRNVLVAGGTGLVGANLTRTLHELGACVRSTRFTREAPFLPSCYMRCDLTELDDCIKATQGMDDVFICAAQTYGAKVMKENPTILIYPNLRINAGLLEACRINQVQRVLFISTSTVYQEAFYPIREDELDLNKPTFELYRGPGGMKRYIEQLCGFYYKRYGMKIGIVRPTNIYGPWDKFDEDTSHVIPALIKRALRREDPYVVWGDGYTVKDFIYVDDFVDDLLNVLERYCVCDPLNVSGGVTVTIREAVNIILDACDHRVTPTFDVTKPTAIPYRTVSRTKYDSIFGTRKRVSFEDGIRRTVEWYKVVEAAQRKEAEATHA